MSSEFVRASCGVIVLAWHTVREALRAKAFAIPVAFAVTAVVLSPFLPTDGTASGAVRLAIKVNLTVASAFGCFAAVMLGALTYHRESRDRTAWLIVTKPVPRWGIFIGRSLGLAALCTTAFAAMAFLAWIFVSFTAARELKRDPTAAPELEEAFSLRACIPPIRHTGPVREPTSGPREPFGLAGRGRAAWRFALPPYRPHDGTFQGRINLVPTDIRRVVLRALNPETGNRSELRLKPAEDTCTFELPEELVAFSEGGPAFVELELENLSGEPVHIEKAPPLVILAGAHAVVAPGKSYLWAFRTEGPARSPAFRLRPSRTQPAPQGVELVLRFGDKESRRGILLERKHTMLVPVEELTGFAGELKVELRNISDTEVRLPAEGSLEFAPRVGSLACGLLRWTFLEGAKAAFLVLATCAGAIALSFPTSALFGGMFLVGGYLVAFACSLLGKGWATGAIAFLLKAVLPDLAGASLAGRLSDGIFVGAGELIWEAAVLVAIRGGLAATIGVTLAHRKEYA